MVYREPFLHNHRRLLHHLIQEDSILGSLMYQNTHHIERNQKHLEPMDAMTVCIEGRRPLLTTPIPGPRASSLDKLSSLHQWRILKAT